MENFSSNNPIDSITKLSRYLKFTSLSFLGLGIGMLLILFLDGISLDNILGGITEILNGIESILYGLIFLMFANGLLKREKWAFYSLIILLSFNLIFSGRYLLFNFSFNSFESLIAILNFGVSSYFFYLLINGKKIFIEQSKEKIFDWFKNRRFLIMFFGIMGIIIINFIILLELPESFYYYYLHSIKGYPRSREILDYETFRETFKGEELPESEIKKLYESIWNSQK